MKKIIPLLMILVVSALLFWPFRLFAQDDDENKITPMDEKLFAEFFTMMKKNHTNAMFSGKITTTRNGAESVLKYTEYFKDLEHYKSDTDSYNRQAVECITPEEIWVYFPRTDDLVYYNAKKELEKRNFKTYIESFKKNGRITKKVKNDETIYTLVNFDDNAKVVYSVDTASGLIRTCREYDGKGELESEKTFAGWQSKTVDNSTFKRPYSSTTKNGDTF